MKFEEIETSIKSKLDDENVSKISDDIANLITLNTNNEKTISDLNKEISKLNKDKETLIQANGNLLQQVSKERESILEPEKKKEEVYTPFDFRSVYDSNGNFKKKL